MTLVKNVADWERYQQEYAGGVGLTDTMVAWGAGPLDYPALVATYRPPCAAGDTPRLVSCYVYRADAEELMAACGAAPAPGSPGQADLNRWLVAYQLTWAKMAREVCCVKPETVEEWLHEALELYDQVKGERRDQIMAGLEPAQRAVIERMRPPG